MSQIVSFFRAETKISVINLGVIILITFIGASYLSSHYTSNVRIRSKKADVDGTDEVHEEDDEGDSVDDDEDEVFAEGSIKNSYGLTDSPFKLILVVNMSLGMVSEP